MGDVKVIIDGKEVSGDEGMTILEAAEKAGIRIPTLCHRPDLSPAGVCRICVVEIEGSPRLVGACHTPIAEGMVILTGSPKVLASRRTTLELMLAGHTGPCVSDSRLEECELHGIASEVELGPPRFEVRERRFYPVEEVSPYVRRDLSKCIMCRRCVKACGEIAKKGLYAIGYRGFASKVIVDCDDVLNTELCRDCGICIDYCPTSALTRPAGWSGDVGGVSGSVKGDSGGVSGSEERGKLLEVLKTEQRESGHISPEAILRISKGFEVSVSEVYGVVTFYSFLSTKPLGRHVIRICRSLPCYLKDAPMIIGAVRSAIGIGPGETTSDRRFSFELTNCIGACDKAPAMLIDHDIHGNLTAERIPGILESYS